MLVRAALLALVVAGCVGPNHEIIEDRFDLSETSGTPEITDVVDVGGADVPLTGNLAMQPSDGVAVVGETLWIRGRSFGRQPAVLVGGRPATVLGRTRDGGIAVRVPAATPSGSQPVVVSNEVGRGERPIAVRRYVAVLAPGAGQMAWAELGVDGPIAAGRLPVPGARWLAMSADGRAAYVAQASKSVLDVVELPSPGAPKIVYQLDLGAAPPVAMAAAGRAQVLAIVRADDVVLVDTTSPLRPARSTPRALPKDVRLAKIVAADLSPDGKLLAVATADGNRVVLLDLVPRARAAVAGAIVVLPDVRQSTLVDVAFSPTGDTLWVLSGDTARSRAAGPQPTELRAIRLGTSPESLANLDIARVVKIEGAMDPSRMTLGRALPLASGAAIRLPPERTTVFFSAARRPPGSGGDAPVAATAAGEMPALTGAAAAPAPKPAAAPAAGAETAVFRVGSGDDATAALTALARLGLPDLSFEGRWLLAPAMAADGSIRILATAVDGRPAPTPAPVDVLQSTAGESPAASRPAPQLRIQP
jgi:hypothetical protein